MAACVLRPQVIPVFAGGLDFSSPVKKFFFDPLGSGKAFVATVVSLTGALRSRPPCRARISCAASTHGQPQPKLGVMCAMLLGTLHGGCSTRPLPGGALRVCDLADIIEHGCGVSADQSWPWLQWRFRFEFSSTAELKCDRALMDSV